MGGYAIRDVGTGFWATDRDGRVLGTSDFDSGGSVWVVQRADDGAFTISKRGQASVWTAVGDHVELKPANGSSAQHWRFERLVG
ncbi:hypothetical protein [Streptomyces broussonetiae]|uniref:Ricin B lectin domain-containing protein n=1 Tax=Streptomyces broussonetiae TaxID=2686304 RepID=A0A6I6MRN1_9ACTN|nr:hypothetical protein [Streptomyces broussonetiae]QHA02963.1 hypothetical protein GQF42_06390 [Streptomyces broussonetiae]